MYAEKNGTLVTQTRWWVSVGAAGGTGPRYLNAHQTALLNSGTSSIPAFGIASGTTGLAAAKIINSAVAPAPGNPSFNAHPTSNHPGGVVAAFSDQRTAFLKDTVAAHVYAQLISADSRFSAGTDFAPIMGSTISGGAYTTNSERMDSWLRLSGSNPYLLKDGDY